MNLRQLEAFRSVVSTGTSVGAARVLKLSQPAVSKLIGDFERSIGVNLFRRESGRLIPTPQAMDLFREVDSALSNIDNIAKFAARLRSIEKGHINILTLPSLAFNFTAKAVSIVAREFPDYNFTVGFGGEDLGLAQLLVNDVDLVMVLMPASVPDVEIIPLVDVRSVCIIPRSHRLSSKMSIDVDDLHGEPLVLVHPRYYWRQRLDEVFRRASLQPLVRLETTNSAHACGAAGHGVGIAIVNELMANEVNLQTAVIRPFTPVIWQCIGIAVQKNKPKSEIVNATIEAMRTISKEYSSTEPTSF